MALAYSARLVGMCSLKHVTRTANRCGTYALAQNSGTKCWALPTATQIAPRVESLAGFAARSKTLLINTRSSSQLHYGCTSSTSSGDTIVRGNLRIPGTTRSMSLMGKGDGKDDQDASSEKRNDPKPESTMRSRMGQRGKDAAQQMGQRGKDAAQHVRQRVGERGKAVGQQVGEGFKDLYNKYGRAAIVTYFSLDVVTFTSCYLAVSNGVDIVGVIQAMGLPVSVDMLGFAPTAGTFVIALAVNKLTLPFRLAATAAIVPRSSKYLRTKFPSIFDIPPLKK